MTTRRTRLQEVARPRLVTGAELAYYLGMSPNTFTTRRARLEAEGLPAPDPAFDLWDLAAVDRWLDARRAALSGCRGGAPLDPAGASGDAFDPDLDQRIADYGNAQG